ncbi:MAG: serine/threonine protein kinase [Proteobacteria bacterium]|nr:serine/threonine protein kinase [Pseudomonadota bacterium]
MARVYRSEKSGPMGFATEVALKIVKRKAGKRSEFVSLLTREAVIGGFLRHPNIVATLDFDQVDGHYYIAMEFVEGHTLEDLIKAANKSGRRFPPLLALDLLQQICRGLSYAHSLSDREGKRLDIIHRDIKPGNIMISNHGVAKITDFGIAKAAVETGVVTATNVVRGTPLYMSPEQATGRPLDFRSDLFSVGLILYEMLTGKRLFEMKDIVSTMESIARAEIGESPAVVDAIVPGLGSILRRLLQLHPMARYDDAEEIEFEIAELSIALANSTGDDSPSIRESLKALTTDAFTDAVPGPSPTPTVVDTDNRIPVDALSLNEMDGVDIRRMADEAADKATAALRESGDQETVPYLDPVIRRTFLGLKQVISDGPPPEHPDTD